MEPREMIARLHRSLKKAAEWGDADCCELRQTDVRELIQILENFPAKVEVPKTEVKKDE